MVQTDKSPFIAGRFTSWFLLSLAVCLWPFYFLQCYSDLSAVWHSPLHAWLPVLREVVGDILKLAIFLWFGFYFKDYASRRASTGRRKKDALQLVLLVCMFFAALTPWYVLVLALLLGVWAYRREMRDIRTEENAAVFEAAWRLRADARTDTAKGS
jgi:hypothetical protein